MHTTNAQQERRLDVAPRTQCGRTQEDSCCCCHVTRDTRQKTGAHARLVLDGVEQAEPEAEAHGVAQGCVDHALLDEPRAHGGGQVVDVRPARGLRAARVWFGLGLVWQAWGQTTKR